MNTSPLDIKFTKRLPANLLSNIVYFVLNIIIGLLLVPFFLDTLGTAAYGLIPLATSITGYITIIIDSLNTSISRYLSIDLQRTNIPRANEIFNTALFGTLGVILVLIPIAILAAWYAPSFFDIGGQSAIDVFVLFALIFGSMFIRAWSSNFMVILFAYNRLDLRNYVNVVNILMQLTLVVTLFLAIGPSLPMVGISYMGAAIVTFGMAFFLSKKTCPYLNISLPSFRWSRLREIGSTSAWVLINSIGLLLNTQVALFIVNNIFGAVAGTEYSLAIVWSSLLISIAGLVTNLFTPMTYSYYSKQDREGLIHFSAMTIKSVGLLMALPIALVCIFSPQILTIWVGEEFANLSPLVWICVAPVIFQIMVSCISPITIAFDRVRSLVILTLPLGVLNVLLAFLFPMLFNVGMYGVALAGLVTLVIRYGLINPIFIAHVIQVPAFFYLKSMAYGAGALFVLSVFGAMISSFIAANAISSLIVFVSVISIIYLIVILKIALTMEERTMILSCLPRTFQRWVPTWLE